MTDIQKNKIKLFKRYINMAKTSCESYNNTNGLIADRSKYYYDLAERLVAPYGIKCDYPGLYPTFIITVGDKIYNEYTIENAFIRINEMEKENE